MKEKKLRKDLILSKIHKIVDTIEFVEKNLLEEFEDFREFCKS